MREAAAKKLCIYLMRRHGLMRKGWRFAFMTSKVDYGDCCSSAKLIRLSKYHGMLKNPKEVEDSILHEICHALVGCSRGHNKVWKKKAIELGCKARAIS